MFASRRYSQAKLRSVMRKFCLEVCLFKAYYGIWLNILRIHPFQITMKNHFNKQLQRNLNLRTKRFFQTRTDKRCICLWKAYIIPKWGGILASFDLVQSTTVPNFMKVGQRVFQLIQISHFLGYIPFWMEFINIPPNFNNFYHWSPYFTHH